MAKTATTSTTLKRQRAGTYATPDGRFVVEQASGGWMVTDAEATNELGLPLVRGPFTTLDAARVAVEEGRVQPAPTSDLAARIAAMPRAKRTSRPAKPDRGTRTAPAEARSARPAGGETHAQRRITAVAPTLEIREWRPGDGEALRRLWAGLDMRSIGDDDDGLAVMARRNPGLVLVASAGKEIVGSALGGWDGRRGWIYHVATDAAYRRRGIARQLVARIEAGLRAAGCRKVNVVVVEGNQDATAFWEAAGYERSALEHFGHVLRPEASPPHGRR